VEVDPGQIQHAIVNLVLNARDAGARRILVGIAPADGVEPGWVALFVRDDGCGMDAGTLARATEPFFSTKRPHEGTGLGLAIVHGIVQQSGGRLEVESSPRRGTTVRVLLPCTTKPRPVPGGTPAGPPQRGGCETVLLVEDRADLRRLERSALEQAGYRVLEAEDGMAALEVAEIHPGRVDLVVTDLVMPRLGGLELAERLRAQRPEVRVLLVSGYPDDPARLGRRPEPPLEKPFGLRDFVARVRAVLDGAAPSSS
jgi:CheY-like chemotaxis protein